MRLVQCISFDFKGRKAGHIMYRQRWRTSPIPSLPEYLWPREVHQLLTRTNLFFDLRNAQVCQRRRGAEPLKE